MADDTQAEPVATEEPTKEPVPSSEAAKAESAEAPNDAGDEADLPEGVSERTKEQFNKLKEANKQLKEQLAQREEVEPIFESMRPKTESGLTQRQLDAVTETDPTTGERFLNESKLESLLSQNTQKAEQAIAQVNRFIEEQQTREAFTAVPQVNPKSTDFDPELHRATRAFLLDSMMNPREYGGRELSYREAAERAMKATRAEIAKVEAEATEQQQAKAQASIDVSGRSDRRQSVNTSEEELRDRIRNGDDDALAALVGD